MHELTLENVLNYARERGWLARGPAAAELLGGGVSNVVFRISTRAGDLVVKQSRPQLRTKEAWFSDVERIFREIEVTRLLERIAPGFVPRVLHEDRENYAFAMSAAPRGAVPWKALLLSGDADPAWASVAGRLLGSIHEATARAPRCVEPFGDRGVFVQLRVEPFYDRLCKRCPDLAPAVGRLVDRLLSAREALCHGDFSPKNLLCHGDRLIFVDHETAHFGDPSMDLGFCLAHLFLKLVKHAPRHEGMLETVRAFVGGYRSAVSYRDPG